MLNVAPEYKGHPSTFLPSLLLGFFVSVSLPELRQDLEQ